MCACGTIGAITRHRDAGTPLCPACQVAAALARTSIAQRAGTAPEPPPPTRLLRQAVRQLVAADVAVAVVADRLGLTATQVRDHLACPPAADEVATLLGESWAYGDVVARALGRARRGTDLHTRLAGELAVIVELAGEGMSFEQIGAALGISGRAARLRHRRHLHAAGLPDPHRPGGPAVTEQAG